MKMILFSGCRKDKSKTSFISLIKKYKLLTLIALLLLSGMIFGTFCVGLAEENTIESLDFLFASNFKVRSQQSLFEIFSTSLTSSFVFVALMTLLGLSVWGVLSIPIVPFFRGFGLGLTAGFLYSNYGIKGFLYHLIVLLPGVIISSVAILIHARESLVFSARLMSKILPKGNIDRLWERTKLYFLRTGYVLIILAASSLVDMLFTMLFSGYFNF